MLSIIIIENVRIGTTSKWNISLDKKTVSVSPDDGVTAISYR